MCDTVCVCVVCLPGRDPGQVRSGEWCGDRYVGVCVCGTYRQSAQKASTSFFLLQIFSMTVHQQPRASPVCGCKIVYLCVSVCVSSCVCV